MKSNKAAVKRQFELGRKFLFSWKYPEGTPLYGGKKSDGKFSATQFREVVRVQTNAIAMAKTESSVVLAKENPWSNATWLYFDQKQKQEWLLYDNGTIEIIDENGYVMQYIPIE